MAKLFFFILCSVYLANGQVYKSFINEINNHEPNSLILECSNFLRVNYKAKPEEIILENNKLIYSATFIIPAELRYGKPSTWTQVVRNTISTDIVIEAKEDRYRLSFENAFITSEISHTPQNLLEVKDKHSLEYYKTIQQSPNPKKADQMANYLFNYNQSIIDHFEQYVNLTNQAIIKYLNPTEDSDDW